MKPFLTRLLSVVFGLALVAMLLGSFAVVGCVGSGCLKGAASPGAGER